jgi:UDP-glucose-4-epimerase GalE
LVTGGAGYIGSHVVKVLVARGREVVIVDNLYNGFRQATQGCPLQIVDIRDEASIRHICRAHSVDSVIHFAALKSVGESMTQPHRYFDWNIGGTVSLVRAIMESGVSKLVFSSSASVYGSAAKIPMDESLPIAPESVYASTKAASESLLFWCSSLGLESVSLRYFNAAGASSDCTIGEDWTTTHNLIPRLMRAMITQQEPLALFGTDYPTFDGTCIRDFIHVEDLAEAHLAALDYLGRGGKTCSLNVGTGVGNSVKEVIALTEQVSGLKVPVVNAPRRPGDHPVIVADPSRAFHVLGWKSALGLSDIVRSAFRWYSRHPVGYSGTK